jgi:glucoamylase
VLDYLLVTQDADGGWPQNMWLDGTPYWTGIQMDETAFPILLADLARRTGALPDGDVARVWPMVRLAASYIVTNGPVTQEDRWEEDPGYSPFTLAVEIAALVVAADLADAGGEPVVGRYLRETADAWNSSIERWTYDPESDLAKEVGVHGYYVRIAPVDAAEAASPLQGFVPIKNRPPGASEFPAAHIVSADALALVRFGLRAPDDPRILDTVRVIDALLKVELPGGPAWRRYNEDGYGEHADGSPFDGTGIGRAWPLLTGERAHYELAAGRPEAAAALLQTMEAFAGVGGLIPEQVWDGPDIPDRELWLGRPSGSAMPLVWAHAEHLKLCRSLRDGRVFDTPPQTVQRYLVGKVESPHAVWRPNQKCRTVPAGKTLRIELPLATQIVWTADGWKTSHETPTGDTGLGLHFADLPTTTLPPGTSVEFRFRPLPSGAAEGMTYAVTVEA